MCPLDMLIQYMEPFWHKPALAMSVEVALAERSSAPQQYVYLVTISRASAVTQEAGLGHGLERREGTSTSRDSRERERERDDDDPRA